MPKQYQIIRKSSERVNYGRWQFVAHGAAYSKQEALDMVAIYKTKGVKARLLLI